MILGISYKCEDDRRMLKPFLWNSISPLDMRNLKYWMQEYKEGRHEVGCSDYRIVEIKEVSQKQIEKEEE